jgi:hypothetical protein
MKSTFATIALALVLPTALLGVAVTASSSRLSAQLLIIGQMPTGWRVISASGGGGLGCMSSTLEPKGIK